MRASVDNPATQETAFEYELTPAEALPAIVESAARAGAELAGMTVAGRIEVCERFLAAFDADSEEVARDISIQMGKPLSESRAELRIMGVRARHMMALAERCLAEVRVPPGAGKDGRQRFIEKVPVGVVLDIAAWNYPLLIPVNVVVPALLAGNAVILKHSSRTPLCAGHFERAFKQTNAGLALVTGIVASHDSTAALIADPGIGYVAFTGSVEGGRAVSRAAAGRFIDVGLELGGKDPAYVRADADLGVAVEEIATGAFYNAGQSCCAVERIYVERSVYGEFVERLCEAASAWTPGDPLADGSKLGPMAKAGAPALISRQIDEAAHKGARIPSGGNPASVDGRGRYFEATVIADATHDMAVMREESFAPLAAVAAVDGDEEAIRLMNDSPYGLAASIWTADMEAARAIGRRVEAGTILVNRCDHLDPALPWAGWKDSGVGLTLSELGFERLVRTRSFSLPTG
ncbi:MAG: aldehyde dehydrogenase family protein [Deltaproteobacteria bacterium]